MGEVEERIESFLAEGPFAVAGASTSRSKYGNKVLRCYLQHALPVFPLHRHEDEIEGQRAFRSLSDLPEPARGLSIITPPAITERIVEEAAAAGVAQVWMQPGAENASAIERAEELGLRPIHSGPCLLVVLGYRESE